MDFHQLECVMAIAEEKSFSKAAKNILILNNQLRRVLVDIADSKKGRLTIGIPVSIERYILPLVLPEFYKRFPGIEIVIEEKPAIKLVEMLVQGEVDIAILHLPIQDKGIEYDPISVEKIFLVAPPGYHIRSIKELKKQQKPENIIMSLNTNQYENCFLIDDINFALVVAYRKGDYLTNAIREFITITKEIIGSKHKSRISDES